MTRINIHNKLHYVLALLIAFTLPFGKLTPLFIGLFFANWLFEGNLNMKFKTLINKKTAILFSSLYLIHLIGLLYTSNINSGFFDIQVKLSLLIFPLVIGSKPFSKKQITILFTAFIVGLIYACIYLLSRSFSLYFTDNINTFFYQYFSVLIHTSYFSMYLNLAIIWLLYNQYPSESHNLLWSKNISYVLILFFSFIILLVSSKSGLISISLTLLVLIGYLVFRKKMFASAFITVLIILGTFFIIKHQLPDTHQRMEEFFTAVNSENENTTTASTSTRLLIWDVSTQVIKNNFIFGVGTGDVKEALKQEYERKEITNALKHGFNAHNEFYQVFLALGVIGFIILILSLVYPMYLSYQNKQFLYIFFGVLIIFNFLSESMLETQAGVMFFAFFNSLIFFSYYYKNDVLE